MGRMRKILIGAVLAGAIAFLTGCASEEEPADTSGSGQLSVGVLEIEIPLKAPVWSSQEEAIFALSQDGQSLVKVDVTGGGFTPDEDRPEAIASSQRLEGTAGENLALEKDREPNQIYVPIPAKDEVYVSEKDDLLEVQTFRAGESPTRVALYPLSDTPRTLFTLSKDGSTVTAMGILAEKEVFARVSVDAGQGARIEASEEADEAGFWVAGPRGVAFYGGGPPFERVARTAAINAEALAVGDTGSEHAYVSEGSSGRVIAVEPGRDGDLKTIAEVKVGEPVTYLELEDGHLYALTSGKLLVLDPENLKTRASVNFDASLGREALKRAEPSGLAVGGEAIYLTLEGEPVLVQIEKP